MKIGLIGPPQSGKSTLFAALTGHPLDPARAMQEVAATIHVPDERLTYLTNIYKPKKTTHANLDIVDFPGISTLDEHAKQHYKKMMPEIRLCDVLVAVVREFKNDSVLPHRKRIDPQADLSDIYDDFLFADMEGVANRLERLEKSLKKPSKTQELEKKELALLERCKAALENLQPLSTVLHHEDDALLLKSFAFLTQKPLVVVVNVAEDKAVSNPTVQCEFAKDVVNICAEVEAQIAQLDPAERKAFLDDLGITTPARDKLIRTSYHAGGLVSFLTCGEDECRAWTVQQGATAVDAAHKIHSDIARGFIRAETIAWNDFTDAGGDMKAVKAAGKFRLEGKTYRVHDGDIIHFKFNV